MTTLYLDELYGFEQDCDFHSEKALWRESVFRRKTGRISLFPKCGYLVNPS